MTVRAVVTLWWSYPGLAAGEGYRTTKRYASLDRAVQAAAAWQEREPWSAATVVEVAP